MRVTWTAALILAVTIVARGATPTRLARSLVVACHRAGLRQAQGRDTGMRGIARLRITSRASSPGPAFSPPVLPAISSP